MLPASRRSFGWREDSFNVLSKRLCASDIFHVPSNDNEPAAATFPVIPPIDPEPLRVNPARVAAVHDTLLLDTAPEEIFDRLTALTARLLNVPVTFLSLVDSDRDYHKSRNVFGKAQEADLVMRGRTFCHYTMVSPTPVVISDATQIPLYRDIASVREQGVRAFAGVPLTTREGQRIGTFCAVDFQPKEWSTRDLETLSELAQAALREISMRQALRLSEENAQAARSAVRAREEVLAVVAHDLQNPLTIIQSSTEALTKMPRALEEGETMQMMKRAADTMQDLVTDLLEVSKIRQGRAVGRQSRIAPDELLRDAKIIMQPIASRSEITIVNNAPIGAVEVLVDYERILRVLANLIGNAIRFSPKHGEVTLHAEQSRTSVRFTVTDYGRGVPESDRAHIFDPYWQRNPLDSNAINPAAGMGLAIAKDIVEAHSGSIGVEENSGPGATFFFILPAA